LRQIVIPQLTDRGEALHEGIQITVVPVVHNSKNARAQVLQIRMPFMFYW
jgi:hypothetical protein